MANRVIRDGILDSERVNQLTWPGEVFYRRLMSIVDDFGRGDGRIPIMRSKLYPLKLDKVAEADIVKWMKECSEAGLISCYQVENKPYFEILGFDQTVRIKKPKYPENPLMKTDESRCEQMSTETKGNEKKQESYIEVWLEDLPNSSHLERIANITGFKKEFLISRIPDFKKKVQLAYSNQSDFLNHFKNWVVKENKEAEPAKIVLKTSYGPKK